MHRVAIPAWALLLVGLAWVAASAQQPAPVAPATPVAQPAVTANAVAATVNGLPIPEAKLQRALRSQPSEKHAEMREQVLEYLIDNTLIDQYLVEHKLEVTPQDVEKRLNDLREDIKKQGRPYEKVLQDLMLTEDELKSEITCDLRWEKYVNGLATEKALRELFEKNPDMFDGSTVRARHILMTPPPNDPGAAQQMQQQLRQMRQQIEDEVAKGMAKLASNLDNLAREQAKARLYEESFAALARMKSVCPSKGNGGELGWFPRAGSMVEPFAKVAFSLKPYQLSDVVQTRFGYHLILVTDRRPGKETKFEDIKEVARDVFSDQLRDLCVNHLRPKAKIVLAAAAAKP